MIFSWKISDEEPKLVSHNTFFEKDHVEYCVKRILAS